MSMPPNHGVDPAAGVGDIATKKSRSRGDKANECLLFNFSQLPGRISPFDGSTHLLPRHTSIRSPLAWKPYGLISRALMAKFVHELCQEL
eukprot:1158838-Pelagomonas_calceolata.AAC.3